jgi:Zn-dependent protease
MSKFLVPFHLYATGWALIALCLVLGGMMAGWPLGLPVGLALLACLLMHEVGHMATATLLGVPVYEFGLRFAGAYNRRSYASTRRDEVLISLSGPLMNLFLAIPLYFVPHVGVQLAMGNLALFVVNLVPMPSSDGLRILRVIWSPSLVPAQK